MRRCTCRHQGYLLYHLHSLLLGPENRLHHCFYHEFLLRGACGHQIHSPEWKKPGIYSCNLFCIGKPMWKYSVTVLPPSSFQVYISIHCVMYSCNVVYIAQLCLDRCLIPCPPPPQHLTWTLNFHMVPTGTPGIGP